MNNGITDRQNEDKSIEFLAAQRQLYNEVKNWDSLRILFSVILPLLFASLQLIWDNNIYLNAASYILSLTSMFVALGLELFLSHKKKSAAEIQQKFDIYVYQMPWDNKLFGKEKEITYIVAKKSKILLEKPGERKKLLNWYNQVTGTVNLEKGILMCQKENYHWDVNLRKRFRRFSSFIVGILISIVLAIGIIKNESIVLLLYRMAFIVPMLQWLIDTIKQLNKDIENLEELDDLINSNDTKNMNELQEIQSKIYVHRQSCYTIPNKFYEKYKDNDEDVAHRMLLLDKKQS